MVNLSYEIADIPSTKRRSLALLWAVTTLSTCFGILFLGFLILGSAASQDFIVIEIYTYLPAIIAILFLFYFRTGPLSFYPFRYPGIHWIAFGVYYTALILILTISTGFLVGELTVNSTFTPIPGATTPVTTIAILDILLYLPFIGFILIFSPGGFIRILGEEYGWRGYLLPELVKSRPSLSLFLSIWIVGGVWFIYHIPFFTIFAPVQDINQMIFLFIGSAGVFFGANLAMVWAYLKTKNLWPALSLHYIWNLTSPVFTGNIYSQSNQLGLFNKSIDTLWLVNGEGLIGGTFHFLIGLVFFYLIIRDKDKLLSEYSQQEKYEIESFMQTSEPISIKLDTLKKAKKKQRSQNYKQRSSRKQRKK